MRFFWPVTWLALISDPVGSSATVQSGPCTWRTGRGARGGESGRCRARRRYWPEAVALGTMHGGRVRVRGPRRTGGAFGRRGSLPCRFQRGRPSPRRGCRWLPASPV